MKGFCLIFPIPSIQCDESYIFFMKGKIFLLLVLLFTIGFSIVVANNLPFNLKGVFFLNNGWSGDG